jgi:hypothetical protein
MSAREVFDVGPHRDGWRIKHGSGGVTVYSVKRTAVAEARRRAKSVQRRGGLAQVRVHGADGKLQDEWTYGKDPRRFKG